jgi:septum formation topological specificity factor MinE
MRTITEATVDVSSLELIHHANSADAARELVELLLAEERFIWPEHEPLLKEEILRCYTTFVETREDPHDLPTDPGGKAIRQHVAAYLGLSPLEIGSGHAVSLDGEIQLKYEALRHAVSILAQIPEQEKGIIPNVERVIEDRGTQVFGLMFQADNRFVFRLRYHTPGQLKESTERLVSALAPRDLDELEPLIRRSATSALAGITDRVTVDFKRITMKTPAGEIAQTGDVHAIGSAGSLALYVASRSPQLVLLSLAGLLMVLDLVLEAFEPTLKVMELDVTAWSAGTLGRATTAAFTAYLFAVLVQYSRLRGRFRGRSAAFIDWRTDAGELRLEG